MLYTSGPVDFLITFIASYLIIFLFLALLILWLIDGRVKKEQALHGFFSAVLALAIGFLVKTMFPTTRPFEVIDKIPLTVTIHSDASFPSLHSAAAFAMAVTIWLHNKKLGYYFLLGASLIGLGRVLAGAHYPLDILGGLLLGGCIAVLVSKVHLLKLQSKGKKI